MIPIFANLLSQAIDRDRLIAALGVPNLSPRATLLEPGLDGVPAPAIPPGSERRSATACRRCRRKLTGCSEGRTSQ